MHILKCIPLTVRGTAWQTKLMLFSMLQSRHTLVAPHCVHNWHRVTIRVITLPEDFSLALMNIHLGCFTEYLCTLYVLKEWDKTLSHVCQFEHAHWVRNQDVFVRNVFHLFLNLNLHIFLNEASGVLMEPFDLGLQRLWSLALAPLAQVRRGLTSESTSALFKSCLPRYGK